MKNTLELPDADEPFLAVVKDTIKRGKQALVFVNTKRRAEKTAETIAKEIKLNDDKLNEISEKVLNVLTRPTKQCKRLSSVIKKGVAFHHSGLVSKQREIVEEEFKKGNIKIICCTPTLAYGLNLPAFRVIIRDLKRYGYRGYAWIPVLEAQQMFGRAGRPKYDKEGEAICIASSENEKEQILKRYIRGVPEDIYSKLAVEPVFRTYLLSLISANIVRTRKGLVNFFSKTFWAYQFKDMSRIKNMIDDMLSKLNKWGFISYIEEDELFKSADILNKGENKEITPTRIGRRTAELYLDPLTAHNIIEGLKSNKKKTPFSIISLCTDTLELRPYLRVNVREFDEVEDKLVEFEEEILQDIPKAYDDEYEDFLGSFKTSLMFYDWINEMDEEALLEKYNVKPGELRAKLQILDWLIYSCHELAVLSGDKEDLSTINKTRLMLKYGVKEELLDLLRLKGIGRVKARKLFNNKIKTIKDLKKCDEETLGLIIGKKLAGKIKEQVTFNKPTFQKELKNEEDE